MKVKWSGGSTFIDLDTKTEYIIPGKDISLEEARDKILTHRVNALRRLAEKHYDGKRYIVTRTMRQSELEKKTKTLP
jgi:hypothetical protein